MRIRTLKPGFFENEDLGALPFGARLLFQGLWLEADREGRLVDRPVRLKAKVFPYDQDVNAEVIDGWLSALDAARMVERYEVDGQRCLQIVNFLKHQRPTAKEPESTIPAPARACVQAQAGAIAQPRAGGDREGEGLREGDPPIVPPPTGGRQKAIDDEFLTTILDEYTPKLGSQDKAQLEIDACLNHKAYDKARDKRQYVKVWMRRSVEFAGSRIGHSNGRYNQAHHV